jgi:hypothetical protein
MKYFHVRIYENTRIWWEISFWKYIWLRISGQRVATETDWIKSNAKEN